MNGNFKSYLAGQIKSQRKQAGMTQAELADAIGRTDEAISNIERRKSVPSIETLIAISNVLNLPIRDFFPTGSLGLNVSINRLDKEAEVMAIIRGLSDDKLNVALDQLLALKNLSRY